MIQILLQFIYLHLFTKSINCFRYNLQPITLSHDFTLETISSIYQSIPYTIPTVSLCLGTPNNQCMNFIISTITSQTMIEKQSDANFFAHQYDPSASITFDDKTVKTTMGFPLFGVKDYYFSGSIILDVVGFKGHEPLKNKFKFVYVNPSRFRSTIKVDGYLGMKKNSDGYSPYLFLEHLFLNKVIDKQTFMLNYNSDNKAIVAFGEDISSITNSTCSTNDSYVNFRRSWYCNITKFSIGDMHIDSNKTIAEFVSVQSVIIASHIPGKAIIDSIINITDSKCEARNYTKYLILVCDKSLNVKALPPIKITMESAEWIIEWKQLMKLTKEDNELHYVSLFIVDTKNNYDWSIGLPGFIDHTIIFDRDNLTIGIENNLRLSLNVDNSLLFIQTILYMSIGVILTIGIGVGFIIKIIFAHSKSTLIGL